MRVKVSSAGGSALTYWLLTALTVVIALAGYAGYVLYPRFDLPAAEGLGLLGLAAGAGVASFFSPCSFPLLVTLLAGHSADDQADGSPGPTVFGASLALGAALFITVVGVVIAIGGAALFGGVTFASTPGRIIRLITGTLLVVLGLSQAGILGFSMHGISRFLQPRVGGRIRRRGGATWPRFVFFGFGYVLAGFG